MKQAIKQAIESGDYREASKLLHIMGLKDAYRDVKINRVAEHFEAIKRMMEDGFINPGVAEIATLLEAYNEH